VEVPTTREGEQPRPSLLLVDDEQPILAALRSILRREGYTLHTFSSAKEALRFLTAEPVDIIISDMRMPDMTGVEFLTQASAILPMATRIILSASEDKQIVIEAVAGGLAQHYVLKPWDDSSLRTLLRNVLFVNKEVIESNLQSILPSVRDLPTAPAFSEKLQGLLASGASTLGDIAEEISRHPAVVARVLKIANSVHFATRKPIVSIQDAIMFIGTEQISILVLGIDSFESVARNMDPKHRDRVESIWSTSLQRAIFARRIAASRTEIKSDNAIYVACLLLDIGIVLRVCNQPRRFDAYLHLVEDDNVFPYEAERRIFGKTHDIVGKALLDYWNIPSSIGEIVAHHHSLTNGDPSLEIVQIADILSSQGEPPAPHDPSIMSLVDEWRAKMQPSAGGT
jgi:HD-like signal output (HDOD) protein